MSERDLHKIKAPYEHIFPDMKKWPIYNLSQDRSVFVNEIKLDTFDRILKKHSDGLQDLLAQTTNHEKFRIKNMAWKIDPPNERPFWNKIENELAKNAGDTEEVIRERNEQLLKRIINRYTEEIVGHFRIQTFQFARTVTTMIFKGLYNPFVSSYKNWFWGSKKQLFSRLHLVGSTRHVRSIMKEGHTVVMLPTHSSNLDSIMIGYVLDFLAGLPSFSYGAGLNLFNVEIAAYFMNRLGAYRVDRRKKNPIYLETLKVNSERSISRGVNNLFFPGGTRSRSGSIETNLKLGLMGTLFDAQRELLKNKSSRKVIVVPVVLSYPFVLEAEGLIEQYLRRKGRGKYIPGDANGNWWTLFRKAIKVMKKASEMTFSMGEPMDIFGNRVNEKGYSLDERGQQIDLSDYFAVNGKISENKQRESVYTQRLADRIAKRYQSEHIVLAAHVVAWTAWELFRKTQSDLSLIDMLQLPPEEYKIPDDQLLNALHHVRDQLLEMEANERIGESPDLHISTEELMEKGLHSLGLFHVKRPLYLYYGTVCSYNLKTLYFYHNRLSTYNLTLK